MVRQTPVSQEYGVVYMFYTVSYHSVVSDVIWLVGVYIYIYSPTVGAGIDERGVILAISTTRLPHFTLHRRHQD